MSAKNFQDLTGMVFGSYTVLGRAPNHIQPNGNVVTKWICQCECGNIKEVAGNHLKSRPNISCGCKKRTTLDDLTGMEFGFYTVIGRAAGRPKGNGKLRTMWLCRCICGTEKVVSASYLKRTKAPSCGCMKGVVNSLERLDNLAGRRFGRLDVIVQTDDYIKPDGRRNPMWICKCDCGNTTVKSSEYLKKSPSPSCGCWKSEITSALKRIDLTGQRFGLLTVSGFSHQHRTRGGHPVIMYKCKCDCGNERIVSTGSLIWGNVKSCGCLKMSAGEYETTKILNEMHIYFKREFTFDDLFLASPIHPLRFDFAILDRKTKMPKILIEYQGAQHYTDKEFGKQQRDITDQMKKDYCIAHDIPLYEIKHSDNIREKLQEIMTHVNPVPSLS